MFTTASRKGWLAGLLLSLAAGACPVLAYACPADFAPTPAPDGVKHGVFYRNATEWIPLAGTEVSFPSSRMELIFVPRTSLCVDKSGGPDMRPDCGDKGFLLVKTTKDTGAESPRKVTLAHGDQFAQETRFRPVDVGFDLYQAFHTDELLRASATIRERWHVRFRGGDEDRSTLAPTGKRLQFAFAAEDSGSAWRQARILRFETPVPDQVVCVPFDVAWNTSDMKLRLDIMLLDPVLDDFAFDPVTFNLTRKP